MSIRLKTILTLLAVAAFAVVLAAQAGAATKKVAVAPGSPAGATPVASSTPDLTPAAIDAGTKAVGHKPTTEQALKAYWSADRMEAAIAEVIRQGERVTYDLKPTRDDPTAVGTSEFADAVIQEMNQ